MESPLNVFISFDGDNDRDFARPLADLLKSVNNDWAIFYDHDSLLSGQLVDHEIEEAIDKVDAVVLLLRPACRDNDNVKKEIRYALSRKVKVFPFKMTEDTEPPLLADVDDRLANRNLPEFAEKPVDRMSEINDRLKREADSLAAGRLAVEAGRVTLTIRQSETIVDRGSNERRAFANEHLELMPRTFDLIARAHFGENDLHNLGGHLSDLLRRSVLGKTACDQLRGERIEADGPLHIEIKEAASSHLDVPWELAARWVDEDASIEAVVTRSRQKAVTANGDPPTAILLAAPNPSDDQGPVVKPFLSSTIGEWILLRSVRGGGRRALPISVIPDDESSRDAVSQATFPVFDTSITNARPQVVHLVASLDGEANVARHVNFEGSLTDEATTIAMVGNALANAGTQLLILQSAWSRNPLDGYQQLRSAAAELARKVPHVIAFMTPPSLDDQGGAPAAPDPDTLPVRSIDRFIGSFYIGLEELAEQQTPLSRSVIVSLVNTAVQLGDDGVGRLLPPIVYLGVDAEAPSKRGSSHRDFNRKDRAHGARVSVDSPTDGYDVDAQR